MNAEKSSRVDENANSPDKSQGKPMQNVLEMENDVREEYRSPLTVLFDEVDGARTLYSFIAAVLILCTAAEEAKCAVNHAYREERKEFYLESFGSLPEFLKIWFSLHLVLYLFVYPCGKFTAGVINSSFPGVVSLCLIKFILLFMMKNAADQGNKLSLVLSLAAGTETVRLLMKSISFLIECSSKETRDQVSLFNFTYFLFAPTLIFRVKYQKNEGPINWTKALVHLLEVAFSVHVAGIFMKNYFRPSIAHLIVDKTEVHLFSHPSIIYHLFNYSFGAIIICMNIAFSFLHSFLNCTGELLRFEDRTFYGWWFSPMVSPSSFMRQYNLVVHRWLVKYLFKAFLHRANQSLAVFCIFIISGLYHDFVVFVAIGSAIPFFLVLIGCCMSLGVLFDKHMSSFGLKYPRLYATTIMTLIILSHGVYLLLLALEHNARLLCPKEPEESWFVDIFRIRLISCISWHW